MLSRLWEVGEAGIVLRQAKSLSCSSFVRSGHDRDHSWQHDPLVLLLLLLLLLGYWLQVLV
jgi:hypothetical protein